MRILLVVHGYPPEKVGGTETYTRNLARGIAADNDVAVFTRIDSEGPEYELVKQSLDGVPVWAVRNTYSEHDDYELHYRNPHIESAFSEALNEFKPDVVHFTYMLGGLSASYLEMTAGRGIKTVVTLTDFHFLCAWGQLMTPEGRECHGPEEGLACSKCFAGEDPYAGLRFWKRWWIAQLEPSRQVERLDVPGLARMKKRLFYLRETLQKADAVISPTRYLQDVYKRWGVESKWIPFAIDKELFDGFYRTESDTLRFGFIGRLLPLKGLHVLAQALKTMPKELPPWKLLIYADDSGDEEKKYLSEIMDAAPDGLEFKGTFEADAIKGVYEKMDVLVLPSLWAENSPLVLLYALHTGTPVVASDMGGVRGVVGENSIFIYPPHDSAALSHTLEGIIGDRSSLTRLEKVEVSGMKEHLSLLNEIYKGEYQ